MKKVVVLTGAGISAESGLKTFRDAGGLWEGHNVYEVASPEGYKKDPGLVLDFYNQRRKSALLALPNAGHLALAGLEKYAEVHIITQNIDILHEKAGSTHVLHLHGRLDEARSSVDPDCIVPINGDIHLGDKAPDGTQLRPNIVWFGEAVPMIEEAIPLCEAADAFIIIGTSLVVYPAAGLIVYVPIPTPVIVVDPSLPHVVTPHKVIHIQQPASTGVPKAIDVLSEIFYFSNRN